MLRRSLGAVPARWQQRIFSGRDLRPPALDCEEDVVKFAMTYSGAVGYMSPSLPLEGPRVLAIK